MSPFDQHRQRIRKLCEEDGINVVRHKVSSASYSGIAKTFAAEWLAEQDAIAAEQAAHQQREVDRDIARTGNWIALWVGGVANAIAVLALAVATYAALK